MPVTFKLVNRQESPNDKMTIFVNTNREFVSASWPNYIEINLRSSKTAHSEDYCVSGTDLGNANQ